ncbi:MULTISPECIES: hypothetical protein [unclassified Bradyrhizobium]|uniref:DUF7940 domain-containing protein n=1 Tax=unclassified Bradyrhizobium TaxID=2631580 RepID=UPI0028E582FF|nr:MULTISPECIES: hypothetical protein [unclassified Bradyrhizobium]
MKIRLVEDWERVLRHAWSVRLLALSFLFDGLEAAFSVLADNPPLPRGTFALLSFVTTVAAGAFRFISQKEFRNGED